MVLRSEYVLTIPGRPAPKGSLKCVGGRGRGGHQLIEDNARTKPWRDTVATWARKNLPDDTPATAQALGAEITFTLERPRSHYGTGKNADKLKPSAPAHPTNRGTGDVDKLLRLILDALQDAGLLPDDSQVVEVTTRKGWARGPEWAGLSRIGTLDTFAESLDLLPYPGVRIRLYPL